MWTNRYLLSQRERERKKTKSTLLQSLIESKRCIKAIPNFRTTHYNNNFVAQFHNKQQFHTSTRSHIYIHYLTTSGGGWVGGGKTPPRVTYTNHHRKWQQCDVMTNEPVHRSRRLLSPHTDGNFFYFPYTHTHTSSETERELLIFLSIFIMIIKKREIRKCVLFYCEFPDAGTFSYKAGILWRIFC